MLDRPHLLITRAKIQPADPGKGNGPRAHGAGLERHIEVAAGQALRPQQLCCLTDCQHLGMRRRVLPLQRPIAGAGDNGA